MIEPELRVQIRRYFFAEHWKIGTIAKQLQVHPDTVRRAIEVERFQSAARLRASNLDPYLAFLRETLEAYPRLCATRLHRMIAERGYTGSIVQLRRAVAPMRPRRQEDSLLFNYGEELRMTFRDELAVAFERGPSAVLRLWCFLICDTLTVVGPEYLKALSVAAGATITVGVLVLAVRPRQTGETISPRYGGCPGRQNQRGDCRTFERRRSFWIPTERLCLPESKSSCGRPCPHLHSPQHKACRCNAWQTLFAGWCHHRRR